MELPRLGDEQIIRILNREQFKYRQQKSNMKKKIIANDTKTVLTTLLLKEIVYLNERIASFPHTSRHV